MTSELNVVKTGVYEFGYFRLVPSERLLIREEVEISLSPKVFDVLVCLVENNGHLVSKDDLLQKVWADTYIEEATLTRTISRLRKVLGEYSGTEYFVTVPKKGYRFVSQVKYFEGDYDKFEKDSLIIQQQNYISNAQAKESLNEDKSSSKDEKTFLFANPRLAVGLGIFAILMISLAFIWGFEKRVKEATEVKSIAVLPFKMIGETEEDKALKLGIADTLIIKFTNLKKIVVRPTSAVSKYAEQEIDSAKVGRELGVDAVLEGSIQKDKDRLRVTVQLLSSISGKSLWAETFNAQEKDIFAIQDNISSQVTEALALKLTGYEQKQLTKRFTENKDAYSAYITGRYLWSRRTPEDLKRALEFFERAVEIDENYALAYTGVADCYQLFAEYRLMPVSEAFAKARNAAKKALELDETLAEAHTSLGYTLAFYDWTYKEAEREFKRAIELNPNYPTARIWYSEFLHVTGRFEESWREIKKAKELAPQLPTVEGNTLALHYLEKDYEKLLAESKKLVEKEPEFVYGQIYLFYGYEKNGLKDEAAEVYFKGVQDYYRDSPEYVAELRKTYKQSGWEELWKKRIEQMKREPNPKKYLAWDFLFCYVRAGNKEGAIEALEQSYKDRDRWIVTIKYDRSFDSIRSEPRFQKIVQQIEKTQSY